jgi:hypothetical protein
MSRPYANWNKWQIDIALQAHPGNPELLAEMARFNVEHHDRMAAYWRRKVKQFERKARERQC